MCNNCVLVFVIWTVLLRLSVKNVSSPETVILSQMQKHWFDTWRILPFSTPVHFAESTKHQIEWTYFEILSWHGF